MVKSRSFIATPPGATIREQLNSIGMTQKEFAVRMDISEKHISRLINGEVQLTQDMAVRLEVVLGVPANFWNNLEAIYREKLIKIEAENTMDEDIALAKLLPYSEMARYGWVPDTRNAIEKVINLRKFFGVVRLSLLENNQITRIACRRLAITKKSDFALLAWAQEAKAKARIVQTEPINIKGLIDIIPNIRKITTQMPKNFYQKVKEILAERGVALVLLPRLKGSFLQGVTFIDGNKIVVGLIDNEKNSDKFRSNLFHELGHIVLGHIGKIDGVNEQDEKDASNWARNNLKEQ